MRRKNPSIGRLFVLLAWVASPAGAATQEGAWTADEAVRRALANPHVQGILDSHIRGMKAEIEAATARPTPALTAAHEQVLGDERVGYRESTVAIQQQLDLSGWRGRLRGALPHRERALRAESAERRLDVATSVRTAFFEVRYREERLRALDAWIGRLQGGVAATQARQRRGDVAPWEVRRVQRELETAHARRAREEALLAESWAGLASWSPWTSRPTLSGDLTPDAAVPPPQPLPRLARLQHLGLGLAAEAEAWGAPWWRGWTVGAGYRFARVGSATGHGFVVSMSIPLALWNNDLSEIERLKAEQARIGSELRLGWALAERAENAGRERLERVTLALARVPTRASDAELTRLAEAAYAAGEATLTELLDAYGSETELALSHIDLQWEARRAAIELDRRRGLGVPR